MKKVLILSLFLSFVVSSYAQKSTDSISQTIMQEDKEVKISLKSLTTLDKEKQDAVNAYKDLKAKYDAIYAKQSSDSVKLRLQSTKLKSLEYENQNLEHNTNLLKEKLLNVEKRLVTMASNFIYIPYEAYSIDSIAIKTFEAVSTDTLRQQHFIKYQLLKNYQNDIRDFQQFLKKTNIDLNKPFVKDATAELTTFQNEPYYIAYHTYNDWEATYIGKKILHIEKQLKEFDGNSHKVDFTPIIIELANCLKTIEDL